MLSYLLPWEFSPAVLLTCLLILGSYVRGVYALRRRGKSPGLCQPIAFALGIALIYASLQTRFDYVSQHMFWVHRLQHLILHHVAPIILVLAAPGEIIVLGLPQTLRDRVMYPFVHLSWVGRLFRLLQHPLIAPLLFVGLIYFWLIPSVHFTAMLDANRYRLMNWSMVIDGLLFWWLMLTPSHLQQSTAISYPRRLVILSVVTLLQILLGAHIALHKTELYRVYAVCGRAWAISPLADQQLGGLLTWIPPAMMSGLAILVVLHRILHSSDRPEFAPQALTRGVPVG